MASLQWCQYKLNVNKKGSLFWSSVKDCNQMWLVVKREGVIYRHYDEGALRANIRSVLDTAKL